MARVLVVQHVAREGLGRLADWLPAAGVDVHPIHPYQGHRVPPTVEGDALIVLGGPMNAYDDDTSPWLPSVRHLLRTAVEDGVPTIGICLGAQLLAVACGGEVRRGDAGPEIGLGYVDVEVGDEVVPAGRHAVVQWHEDTVTRLPEGATVLGSSAAYPVQAFRCGELAWGLQFHIEATPEMVDVWAASEGRPSPADEVREQLATIGSLGQQICNAFARIVTG